MLACTFCGSAFWQSLSDVRISVPAYMNVCTCVSDCLWIQGTCSTCVSVCLCQGYKELAVLTQKHRQKSEENLTRGIRPPMQKSYSQGDSTEDIVGMVMPESTTTRDYRRRPRVHNYEEIKPKIIYADVDFLQAQRQTKLSTLN